MANSTETAVSITVDDTNYVICLSDLTAIDAGDFRRAVGVGLAGVMANGGADLDVIAGLVWLARRKREPGLKYETVARALTYDSAIDIDPDSEHEEPGDDPEA